ncbi:choice-of-anchor J domain-containing protein [Prevotella dentasini]
MTKFTFRRGSLGLLAAVAASVAAVPQDLAAQNILLSEGFEAKGLPQGWSTLDQDEDGKTWKVQFRETGVYPHTGEGMATSASFQGKALHPDNYLISPLVEGVRKVSFYVCALDVNSIAEHYGVYYSTTDTKPESFVLAYQETLGDHEEQADKNSRPPLMLQSAWLGRSVELPEGTKYVAFRHFDCSGQFRLNLDDVVFYGSQQAATEYGINIGEKKITSENAGDVLADGGSVRYDAETRVLTLTDAHLTSAGQPALKIEKSGTTVLLNGTSKIDGTGENGIVIGKDVSTVVSGKGTLEISGKEGCGIRLEEMAHLHLTKGCAVTVKMEDGYGILGGTDTKYGQLTVDSAALDIATPKECIYGLKKIAVVSSAITQPGDAYPSYGSILSGGKECKGRLVIIPVKEYGIQIGGRVVNSYNAADVRSCLKEGKVSYDAGKNVLTLEDAYIQAMGDTLAVVSDTPGLVLELKGKNFVHSEKLKALSLNESCTIRGEGSLTVEAPTNVAIALDKSTLTIEGGATVEASGYWGVSGNAGAEAEVLRVVSSTLKARGSSGAVCDLKDLEMEGCGILSPADAYFDKEAHAIVEESFVRVAEVLISIPTGIGKSSVPFEVEGVEGGIVVSGQKGHVGIYTLTGSLAASCSVSGSPVRVSLPTGVYLVKSDSKTAKVVVR